MINNVFVVASSGNKRGCSPRNATPASDSANCGSGVHCDGSFPRAQEKNNTREFGGSKKEGRRCQTTDEVALVVHDI